MIDQAVPKRFHFGTARYHQALVQMHQDTQAQRHTLEQAHATPGLVEQVVTPNMVPLYCAQQADLRGYHRILMA